MASRLLDQIDGPSESPATPLPLDTSTASVSPNHSSSTGPRTRPAATVGVGRRLHRPAGPARVLPGSVAARGSQPG